MSKPSRKSFQKILFSSLIFFVGTIIPVTLYAAVTISEVMYDLKEGSDTGREWVEIFNSGPEAVKFSDWKFFEADTNHKISTTTAGPDGFIAPNAYGIIVDDLAKFSVDWPGLSATIFSSSFSLSNTGEKLAFKDPLLATVDEVTYANTQGGNGDGNSLQKVNGVWQGLAPSPGGAPQSASNQATTSVPSNSETVTSSQTSQPPTSSNSSNSASVNLPPAPQIYAFAGSDRIGTAGTEIEFSGQALGLNKEPLTNARFIWSFGDGSSADGRKTLHTYRFPGEYLVSLDVASAEFSVSDRVKVTVNQASVSIINQIAGIDGGITLKNRSKSELDISSWILNSQSQNFIFPLRTIILPEKQITFPNELTGLSVTEEPTALLYPNGRLAAKFENTSSKTTVAPSEPKAISASLPQKIVANQVERNEAVISKQTASAGSAVRQISLDSNGPKAEDGDRKIGVFLWLGGAIGISIFGAGTFWYLRQSRSRNIVDEITIIE